ncbi:uncharacterized protein LOC115451401 [Manduca sexta]|uniref:uncharacterized protein LOC115451401 n=1 Tax=Manduca sexta TaxID=7130 RepID=UPI00188EFD48|nr:uncharacterized protein LOC115451401 [Manduca sexta]
MLITILMLTSLLIQAYSVPDGDNQDPIATKGRYHFNHPPSVENYNPIEESLQYSENTVNKPRIDRELSYSEDDVVTNDKTSTEIVPDQLSIDNVQVVKKNEIRERVLSNKENSALEEIESTKFKKQDEVKSKSKDTVRKSKVKVRKLSKSLQEAQTTTLKPIVSSNRKERRERDPVVPIVESENRVYGHNGKFHYSYVGGDGTRALEEGKLKVFDDKTTGEAVEGSFSYTDKDGNDFSLSYTADENGYRPIGAHLPTPPPIPPAIARALQYLATKTVVESTTKI